MPVPLLTDPLIAAALLRKGALVAFGTETVYGLGADATSDAAVAQIFTAKGRPRFNPLIAHVASVEAARALISLTPDGEALADAFWPGPLTLVGERRGDLSELVTAGLPTLGVRVPASAAARAMLEAADRPIAAPSANPSGKLSPTRAADVAAEMGSAVAGVLDTGPSQVGLESTIIALTPDPTLLRHGGISRAEIEAVLGKPLETDVTPKALRAPGQLASHYAPNATLRLNAQTAEPGEVFLGFGTIEGDENLSTSGNLVEAATRLFALLRTLDARGVAQIAVAPVPNEGLGEAINDRLTRAAAKRS